MADWLADTAVIWRKHNTTTAEIPYCFLPCKKAHYLIQAFFKKSTSIFINIHVNYFEIKETILDIKRKKYFLKNCDVCIVFTSMTTIQREKRLNCNSNFG